MQTIVQDLVSQDPKIAITLGVLGVIGAYKVLGATLSFASFLKRHLLRGTYDFRTRYGKEDSWVVVTGGSDGIGLEICEQLAAQKFNICIVGRTKSKVDEKLSQIAKKFEVKTRAVIFDFAQLCTIQDYKTKIADEVKDIDIAMLFLNAGYAQCGAFVDQTDADVQSTVAVNALQPIYTAKVLLNQMLARDKLSALVITSSGLGAQPVAGILDYSCTKTFVDFLAQGLSFELEGKVDCLSWQAGEVSTKMLKRPAGGTVVTTEVAVKGMFKDLGKERMTRGCFTHDASMVILPLIPEGFFNRMMLRAMVKTHKRQLEKGIAAKKTE